MLNVKNKKNKKKNGKKNEKKKTAQPLDCRLHCAVQNQVNLSNPEYVS
jgi:hypothetical protein